MKKTDKEKRTYFVTRSVLEIIERFIQRNKSDKESGGILLGQLKGNEVFILKVSTPNKYDKASRYSFNCNKDAAQIIIDYEFKNSGRKTIYLGEWHTHPEDKPNPSRIDKKMINNQYFKNKLNEPFLVLIIQGIKEIFIAHFEGNKLEEISLNIIDD